MIDYICNIVRVVSEYSLCDTINNKVKVKLISRRSGLHKNSLNEGKRRDKKETII